MNFSTKIIAGAIALLLTCIIAVPSMLWHAFVVCKLWDWFISPFFHVDPLPMTVAIGLTLIAGAFTNTDSADYDKENGGVRAFMNIAGKPALLLLFGWIVTLFM